MDKGSILLFDAMTSKMRQLTAKQQVIARNVANVDTPGYQARSLVEKDFSSVLATVESSRSGTPSVAKPTIDVPSALKQLGSPLASRLDSDVSKNVFETKPNGNSVSLEDQLLQLSDVQVQYNTLTNLYRKQTGLLKLALGRGR